MILRFLIFIHRWLGVALCLVFLLWFPSGIGMMYWGFPGVTAEDRLDRSPRLDPARILLSPAEAAEKAGLQPSMQMRLNSFDGRPVYRLAGGGGRGGRGGGGVMVYADTGEQQTQVSSAMLDRIAAAWTSHPLAEATKVTVDEVDQWTVAGQFRSARPLYKYSWPNGEQVYLNGTTGEVVQYTTFGKRLAAHVSAIPHWIYYTPLRRNQPVWLRFMIWSSLIGTGGAIIGVVIGVWMYSPKKKYRLAGKPTGIPYRGQKRWHTILGLVFGIATITWTFSGLLSLGPFPIVQRLTQPAPQPRPPQQTQTNPPAPTADPTETTPQAQTTAASAQPPAAQPAAQQGQASSQTQAAPPARPAGQSGQVPQAPQGDQQDQQIRGAQADANQGQARGRGRGERGPGGRGGSGRGRGEGVRGGGRSRGQDAGVPPAVAQASPAPAGTQASPPPSAATQTAGQGQAGEQNQARGQRGGGPQGVAGSLRGRVRIEDFATVHPRDLLAKVADLDVRELELTSFAGTPLFSANLRDGKSQLLSLDGARIDGFDQQQIIDIVKKAAPDPAAVEIRVIDQYDLYYLDRTRQRPLPVILALMNDADQTRYYIDPKTARVLTTYSNRNWVGRWLYNGLHSLNFPWLYNYRPLWDIVVITFMVGGTALCVTSLVLAWRVLGRKLKRAKAASDVLTAET